MNSRLIAAIASGLVFAFVFYTVDMTTLAGAHPRWSTQLFLSGAGLGTVLAFMAIQFSFVTRSIALTVLAVAAYAVATFGKNQFTISLAEDAFAGRMWYFGWHILCIAIVAQVISATAGQLKHR